MTFVFISHLLGNRGFLLVLRVFPETLGRDVLCGVHQPVIYGEFRSISECPRDAVVSSLSAILQEDVPSKYYLTPKACLGILLPSHCGSISQYGPRIFPAPVRRSNNMKLWFLNQPRLPRR